MNVGNSKVEGISRSADGLYEGEGGEKEESIMALPPLSVSRTLKIAKAIIIIMTSRVARTMPLRSVTALIENLR